MNKRKERIWVVNKIICVADMYKRNLLGKTFLYVFNNEYIEVSFRKADFAHLTGIDKHLSAVEFYKEAVRGTLREKQVFFSKRFPRDLCLKKLRELHNLFKLTCSDLIVLKDIKTSTKFYKFGFTDLDFTLCVCEDIDENGNKKSGYFVPRSFRIGDCFEKSREVYSVDFIFSKENNKRFYNKLNFGDKEKIKALPIEIKNMLEIY